MIQKYLEKAGFHPIPSNTYAEIPRWKEWYRGKTKFHKYTVYNGKSRVTRHRASLRLAKRVCEDWANLILNEKIGVSADNEETTNFLKKQLEKNNFSVCANRLVEHTFALGTGAFTEYIADGNIKIDYVCADKIFPLSYENGRVTECAFGSFKKAGPKKYAYIQVHTLKDGRYHIQNMLFDTETDEKAELPKGMMRSITSDVPLFQIVTPNIVNTAEDDCDSPFGVSVFADALDILLGADAVYDSYINEFVLGKKRVYVPLSMAQIEMEKNGTRTPVFDADDVVFYGLEALDELRESDMSIRSSEHREGLQVNLNLLSDRVGLGTNRYIFDRAGGIKTATEVISENSDLFRNLKKHEHIFSEAIRSLCRAVLYLAGKESAEIKTDFGDAIIQDKTTEFTQRLQMVSAGIMSKTEFRMKHMGESEDEARKKLAFVTAYDDGIGDE